MTEIVHIIDDDSQARAACSFLLSNHGYETRIYDGGLEFLGIRPADGCAVMRMHMSGMNGLEVHKAMMVRGIIMPLIVLDGDVPQAVKAMQQGAIDFITTPYDPDLLIQAVERAFLLAREREERRVIKAVAKAKLSKLTARKAQVLQGLNAGMANKKIAHWLDLSQRTVESYRAAMMADIGATSISQAVRIAIDGDLPSIDDRGAEIALSL